MMVVNIPKKLILDIDEATWKEVLKYKIDCGLKNNDEDIQREGKERRR